MIPKAQIIHPRSNVVEICFYEICFYCGRSTENNTGKRSCDGCGAPLVSKQELVSKQDMGLAGVTGITGPADLLGLYITPPTPRRVY